MSNEIFLKCFIEYFFLLFNTWFRYWIVWYFVWYIMQIIHIANWCTWLAHTLCKGLIWNYKNCWAQPWLSFGSYKRFDEVDNVSDTVFFLPMQDFVLKFWNLHYFHLLKRCIYLKKQLFRLLNCLHIFADFVIFFSFGWWKISIK